MKVKLKHTDRIKNYLIFKYTGVCGIGSNGNSEVDQIIEQVKSEFKNQHNIQGIIYDFHELRYNFGNRYANLFNPSKYFSNNMIYIRIVPNENDLANWQSLQKEYSSNKNESLFQIDIQNAVISINSEMNQGESSKSRIKK